MKHLLSKASLGAHDVLMLNLMVYECSTQMGVSLHRHHSFLAPMLWSHCTVAAPDSLLVLYAAPHDTCTDTEAVQVA